MHPGYGDIGTYSYTISNIDGVTHTTSELHVTVRLLGMVIFRQDADETSVIKNSILQTFASTITTNGHELLISGIARSGKFYLTTAKGLSRAPADVMTSDPWFLKRIGQGSVISTRTGQIHQVQVTGGEDEVLEVENQLIVTRHFHVRSDQQGNKWEVWLDAEDTPIQFRSLEAGVAISFILASNSSAAAERMRLTKQTPRNSK